MLDMYVRLCQLLFFGVAQAQCPRPLAAPVRFPDDWAGEPLRVHSESMCDRGHMGDAQSN